jgi:hypothetical protein
MTPIRRFAYTIGRHPGLTRAIIVVLPMILAAFTNGGSTGPGY